MIEVKRCTFGTNNVEGVGVFLDDKLIAWKNWRMMKDKPLTLTLVGAGTW